MTHEAIDSGIENIGVRPPTADLQHRYKVSIRNLDAWFGMKQALKNISLDIKKNAATAIIGPSAAARLL